MNSVNEVAAALGVSAATVRNWLRLGKLESLSLAHVEELHNKILSGEGLRSRRNKTALRHSETYCGYIDGHRELAALLGGEFSDGEIRVILTEAALRLFCDGENLTDAFLDGTLKPDCAELFSDLLGGFTPTEKTRPVLSARWTPDKKQDVLGFIYMSLLPLNLRRRSGAYYTPPRVASLACGAVTEGPALDPCCGSGSFLLALSDKLGDTRGLFAVDVDSTAVALARINLFRRRPELGADYLFENIKCKSFFDVEGPFRSVAGNPPWGGSPEASGRFLLHSLDVLEAGGRLSLVLPQSLLTALRHGAVRERLLAEARLVSADFVGCGFDGVSCPAVALSAEKGGRGTVGCRVNSDFTVHTERDGRRCLNLKATDDEYKKLRRMRELENAVFLKGRARFALGVVTGGNSAALGGRVSGAEPVIRGGDVSPFSIAEPRSYIVFKPSRLQQCAPEEVYRAKEKIVYRFIGRRPVFAVDRLSRLTLNSCNIIIPNIPGLSIDYITAVLNSAAVGFFLEKSFDAQKWLRWHLEEVPIPFIEPERQREILAAKDRDGLIWELYGLEAQ